MAALEDSITLRTNGPGREISDNQPTPRRQVLLYFIPGNPGLIEYYRLFLTHLQSALKSVGNNTNFSIVGNSLAGFHVSDNKKPGELPFRLPLNLRGQIEDVELQLLQAASSPETTTVILIGHSVGVYILMSLLERRHKGVSGTAVNGSRTEDLNIAAGICLFPTVVDLHASPNGRKAGWIAPIPGLSHLLQAFARLLCWLTSFSTLISLVRSITGQPEPAAKVTASFLASPKGVRQAIYLAQHELREMREDRWSDETWGATSSSLDLKASKDETGPKTSSSKGAGSGASTLAPSLQEQQLSTSSLTPNKASHTLFFYWGAADHWIANSTRDAVIATRASHPGARMEIDTQGLPHDFCVREKDAVLVADKVAEYVREIVVGRKG